MPTADFFGHKADPAGRIFDAVLHDICHLERKPKAHIQLLHFGLAGIVNQASICGKKIRQKLSDNACHVVAVFIKVSDTFKREPAGT